jgi:hypothetical protein
MLFKYLHNVPQISSEIFNGRILQGMIVGIKSYLGEAEMVMIFVTRDNRPCLRLSGRRRCRTGLRAPPEWRVNRLALPSRVEYREKLKYWGSVVLAAMLLKRITQ